jgi:Protein of unknown function (DUF3347)
MKSILKMFTAIIVLLSITSSYAQIKNAKIESIKIYGNCEICKNAIEKAGNVKKITKVDWNEETKMASITYNPKLTNRNTILKRIALSGYDSDLYLAPDLAYSKLASCCKYERKSKILPPTKVIAEAKKTEHANENTGQNMPAKSQKTSQMQLVFNDYFKLKDALVNTDANTASANAGSLLKSLNAIKMNELEMDVHMVWMKVMTDLNTDAKQISMSNKIDQQREHFIPLSKNMYALLRVAKTETPTYYQFCPMANNGKGANWLSKENEIKNPFYGSEMMTCGKTVETIK